MLLDQGCGVSSWTTAIYTYIWAASACSSRVLMPIQPMVQLKVTKGTHPESKLAPASQDRIVNHSSQFRSFF